MDSPHYTAVDVLKEAIHHGMQPTVRYQRELMILAWQDVDVIEQASGVIVELKKRTLEVTHHITLTPKGPLGALVAMMILQGVSFYLDHIKACMLQERHAKVLDAHGPLVSLYSAYQGQAEEILNRIESYTDAQRHACVTPAEVRRAFEFPDFELEQIFKRSESFDPHFCMSPLPTPSLPEGVEVFDD